MRRRGLTLLELIVCLSVVLLLVIFVLNLFPGSLLALRQSEARLEAQRQAELVLDRARLARFDTYAVGTTQTLAPRALNGNQFVPTLEARALAGYDSNQVKELRASVSWDDHGTIRYFSVGAWVSRAH